MANEIFTRLQLKHDTYANWIAVQDTFKPLAGEICVVEIPSANSATTTTPPTVLFKVGMYKKDAQGNDTTELYTFKELNWGSALAADVYAWAKEQSMFSSVVATETTSGEGDKQKTYVGNAVTDVEWDSTLNDGKGGIKFTKGIQFATKAELDAALEAFGGDLDAITDTDTRYSFTIPTTGDHKGKLEVIEKKYVNGTAEGNGTTTYYDFVTPDELETILEGYVVKVEGEGCIEVDNTDSQNPVVKHVVPDGAKEGGIIPTTGQIITKVSTDKFGHVNGYESGEASVLADTSEDDLGNWGLHLGLKLGQYSVGNVALTGASGIEVRGDSYQTGLGYKKIIVDGSELLQDAKDYTDEEIAKAHANVVDYRGVANALTDLAEDAGKGDFYRIGTEIKSGDTILAYAGDLIVAEKDKPAQQIDGTNWTAIHCGDGDISEVVAGDGLTGGGATGSVTIGLSDATKASLGNADTAYGWGDHAQEGYLKAGDIANKADKVAEATDGNFAGLDADGNLTDSGYAADRFATSEQGAKADSAIQEVSAPSIDGLNRNVQIEVDTKEPNKAVLYANVIEGGIETKHLADNAVTTQKLQGARKSTGADSDKYIVIFNCGSSTTVI